MSPLEQLTELLGLDVAGIKVTGAQMYGRGSDAAATIWLSNSETLEFESLRSMARPQTLLAEVASIAGVVPDLKQPGCMRVIALVSEIATNEMRLTEVDQAHDWGTQYVQSATTLAVDTSDQGQRWGAWAYLHKHDPWTTARDEGSDLARAGKVIHDRDGSRLVRSGWYLAFVRTIAPRISHIRLPILMEQAGWQAPRRIKATNPSRPETLVWNFYTVPADWETDE
jgi:hypothetical protein